MWTRLALLCYLCLSALAMQPEPETNPEETPGFFEGDMDVIFKNGVIQPSKHWPNATVYYKINETLEEGLKNQIRKAMVGIQNVTCVRFKEADKEKNFVLISDHKNGCTSSVGYRGRGEQGLNLAIGCYPLGIIQHELLHTLGFYHQQSSHDRDRYVVIYRKNIKKGHEHNFNIHKATDNFGAPYDYGSLMHYGRFYFSKNKTYLPTIGALRPSEATGMGQREGLSQTDVTRIKNMYNCSVPTTDSI